MLLNEPVGEDVAVRYFINRGGVSAIPDYILGLYRRIGNHEYADRYLTFIDADGGSVIRLIEDLTGEDREDYRIDGPLSGVFVME